MTTKDKKLRELVVEFANSMLGTKNIDANTTKQKCFAICYPLSLHLENNNYENSLVFGKYKDETDHTWLVLEQAKKTIIDPTYNQFYPDKPFVHIGKKPKDYKIFCKDMFTRAYDSWLCTFLNQNGRGQDNFKTTGIDWNESLKITIRAAIILNNEIENLMMDVHKSKIKRRLYFHGIFEILNECQNDLTEFSKINGFDKLILKKEEVITAYR